MKDFKGKTAVITGAASGIGYALAERCVVEGMKVVLADVEQPALARTDSELRNMGADVLSVLTDVSKASDVDELARRTVEAFGGIDLLFNNAGVSGGSSVWESSIADWEWVLGVNLWGLIHVLRTFVPIMIRQDRQCRIVNTASLAGLISPPGMSVYNVSKHGVVTLSETLFQELAMIKSKVRVSVLCPSFVKTRIHESERNRSGAQPSSPVGALQQAINAHIHDAVESGMSPQNVADITFQAIRDNRFYIITHPDSKPAIHIRSEDILLQRDPTNLMAERAAESN